MQLNTVLHSHSSSQSEINNQSSHTLGNHWTHTHIVNWEMDLEIWFIKSRVNCVCAAEVVFVVAGIVGWSYFSRGTRIFSISTRRKSCCCPWSGCGAGWGCGGSVKVQRKSWSCCQAPWEEKYLGNLPRNIKYEGGINNATNIRWRAHRQQRSICREREESDVIITVTRWWWFLKLKEDLILHNMSCY